MYQVIINHTTVYEYKNLEDAIAIYCNFISDEDTRSAKILGPQGSVHATFYRYVEYKVYKKVVENSILCNMYKVEGENLFFKETDDRSWHPSKMPVSQFMQVRKYFEEIK